MKKSRKILAVIFVLSLVLVLSTAMNVSAANQIIWSYTEHGEIAGGNTFVWGENEEAQTVKDGVLEISANGSPVSGHLPRWGWGDPEIEGNLPAGDYVLTVTYRFDTANASPVTFDFNVKGDFGITSIEMPVTTEWTNVRTGVFNIDYHGWEAEGIDVEWWGLSIDFPGEPEGYTFFVSEITLEMVSDGVDAGSPGGGAEAVADTDANIVADTDATEAPTQAPTEAPTNIPATPQTGDASVIFILIAVLSVSVIAVSKNLIKIKR